MHHNHICSAVDDPKIKDYDVKVSSRSGDVLGGAMVEHTIFYLIKTSGDVKSFPEKMPVQLFAEILKRNTLQIRKRVGYLTTKYPGNSAKSNPVCRKDNCLACRQQDWDQS